MDLPSQEGQGDRETAPSLRRLSLSIDAAVADLVRRQVRFT